MTQDGKHVSILEGYPAPHLCWLMIDPSLYLERAALHFDIADLWQRTEMALQGALDREHMLWFFCGESR
jgi:hypothetical protein